MGRTRHVRPEFFLDEDLGKLDPLVRLAFVGLWIHADREGRLEDRPLRLKVQVLPFDDVDFDAILDQLAGGEFICRYEVEGRKFINIRNFGRYQHPHPREVPSTIPPPGKTKARPRHNLGTAEATPRQVSGNAKAPDTGVSLTDTGVSDTGDRSSGAEREPADEFLPLDPEDQEPAPPIGDASPQPPIDPDFVEALGKTEHLRELADPRFGTYWRSLVEGHDREDLYFCDEIAKADLWLIANPNRPRRNKAAYFRNWIVGEVGRLEAKARAPAAALELRRQRFMPR